MLCCIVIILSKPFLITKTNFCFDLIVYIHLSFSFFGGRDTMLFIHSLFTSNTSYTQLGAGNSETREAGSLPSEHALPRNSAAPVPFRICLAITPGRECLLDRMISPLNGLSITSIHNISGSQC